MSAYKIRLSQVGYLVLLIGTLSFAILTPSTTTAQQMTIERPDSSMLQNGDLIWPKNPKAIVPYDSGYETRREAIQKQWESERDAFVAKVRRDSGSSAQMRQLATNLEALSYADFTMRYLADVQKSDIEKFGGIDDILSVGHVGIVEVTADGQRFVIEAVLGNVKKVQRIPYSQWLAGRADSWVWVGRFRDISDTTKQKFVEQSKSYIDRPYDFWNFNLSDDSSFYCSKLVWLSYARSIGTSIDGAPAERMFWFSPKQLWNLNNRITRVNVPRDYSY